MKKILLIIILTLPICLKAQIVNTFAGGGTGGAVIGEPATIATLSDPADGKFDKHENYYFTESLDGNRIRNIAPSGIITTLAGTGVAGFSGDGGPATNAMLNGPAGTIIDSSGNLYICDLENFRIRKVDAATGFISTIAGSGVGGYITDGVPATSTSISNADDLCIDKHGNLYIADYGNGRIRMVNTLGIISTFAGNGPLGAYSGDGVAATATAIGGVGGMFIDGIGNIYAASNSLSRVFKIDTAGIITTVAGTGASDLYNGDGIPAITANIDPYWITIDNLGNLYIAEYHNFRVRMVNPDGIISTVAGNGLEGYSGDGGPATAAKFNFPSGVALDTCGNLYIPDNGNNRVRKVTFDTTCSIAGGTLNVIPISQNDCSIYPNPASTSITITAPQKINTIIISNILGQMMLYKESNSTQDELNIGNLPQGMYLVKVTDDKGVQTVNRIIKE